MPCMWGVSAHDTDLSREDMPAGARITHMEVCGCSGPHVYYSSDHMCYRYLQLHCCTATACD
jgi:hypothetical protein